MFPSVTTILAPYSGIAEIKKRYPDIIARAAERGTAVHKYCEDAANFLFPAALPENWQGYGESFLKWLAQVDEVIRTETRFFDYDMKFCGQFDIICRMKGDKHLSLWDYKSSEVKDKTWPLQIAAYRHLARREGLETKRGGMIRLRRSGRPPLIDEYTATERRDWNLFVSALNIHLNFFM